MPAETNDVRITIKWNEPQNNGAPITQYTVYTRTLSDDGTPREWNRINIITDLLVRQVAVILEKGKNYEFVVTAANRFGESLKEGEKIKKIVVLGGKWRLLALFKKKWPCGVSKPLYTIKKNLKTTVISRLNSIIYKIPTK